MAFGLTASLALALAAPSQGAPEPAPTDAVAPATIPGVQATGPMGLSVSPEGTALADVPAGGALTPTAQTSVRAADAALSKAEVRAAALVSKHAAAQARTAQVRQTRAKVVAVARKQVGDTYAAGGNGPSRFDCSGLTQYVFRVAAGKSLPHQSRAQFAKVRRVSKAQAQPGDLVFFFRGGAHHVGIYIGKGRMIDARGYGKGVKVSPISGSWWGRAFSGIGRILPAA